MDKNTTGSPPLQGAVRNGIFSSASNGTHNIQYIQQVIYRELFVIQCETAIYIYKTIKAPPPNQKIYMNCKIFQLDIRRNFNPPSKEKTTHEQFEKGSLNAYLIYYQAQC